MATVTVSKKACTVNPLKMSQPIGAALAFMGLRGAMPLGRARSLQHHAPSLRCMPLVPLLQTTG